jgi:sec-independent protein translocase protein TatB
MFDIGFWELVVVGLVALVVVGPERLPKLAYTAGKWLSKGRRMVQQMKLEIDKEIKAEELKRVLAEQQKKLKSPIEEIMEQTSGAVVDLKKEAEAAVREVQGKPATKVPVPDTTNETVGIPPGGSDEPTEPNR